MSETHDNSIYEDTKGRKNVYIKAPFNALIELQEIPNGYYYPENSDEKVFTPGK
ncbi:hypothetical protein FH107_03165 [Staphylococcus hominis]|nr:hypothetical protein [Staphylococcus hominis]